MHVVSCILNSDGYITRDQFIGARQDHEVAAIMLADDYDNDDDIEKSIRLSDEDDDNLFLLDTMPSIKVKPTQASRELDPSVLGGEEEEIRVVEKAGNATANTAAVQVQQVQQVQHDVDIDSQSGTKQAVDVAPDLEAVVDHKVEDTVGDLSRMPSDRSTSSSNPVRLEEKEISSISKPLAVAVSSTVSQPVKVIQPTMIRESAVADPRTIDGCIHALRVLLSKPPDPANAEEDVTTIHRALDEFYTGTMVSCHHLIL
jgi:hypothetical protein